MKKGCVILNYNDSERVIRLAKKLLSMEFFEKIVIVDNCSKEEDFLRIFEFVETQKENLYTIKSEKNVGFNVGANLGFSFLSAAEFDLIYHINSDVDIEKNVLLATMSFLDKHKDIAVVSCRMLQMGEEKKMYYNYPTTTSLILDNLGISKLLKLMPKKVEQNSEYYLVDFVRGSFCAMRREDVQEAGFFYSKTFLYFGEAALSKNLLPKKEAVLTDFYYIHNHPNPKKAEAIAALKLTYKDAVIYLNEFTRFNLVKKILLFLSVKVGIILRYFFLKAS